MIVKPLIPTLFLVILSLLAVGCSQTPAPISRPYTTQNKLQAAQHWRIIAQDISTDISQMIKMSDLENYHSRHVQILKTDGSPFSKALESFLVTDLTHLGLNVDRDYAHDYQLYWSVQSVTHKEPRQFTSPPFGTFTAAGALGYGVYKIFDESTDFARAVTAGASADIMKELLFLSQIKLPKNEIIVNVTIQSGNAIIYRLSNSYYINDMDTDHYHFSNDLYYADKDVETRTVHVIDSDSPHQKVTHESRDRIYFGFDKHTIQDKYKRVLDEYILFLKRNPQMNVLIEGHTDIIGSEKYNLDLSLQRAKTVHDYFVQHSISSQRLQTKGYGFSKPIAPNFTDDRKDNPEGRAKNRRVEIHPINKDAI